MQVRQRSSDKAGSTEIQIGFFSTFWSLPFKKNRVEPHCRNRQMTVQPLTPKYEKPKVKIRRISDLWFCRNTKKDKGTVLSFSASFWIKYSNGGCSGFEPDFPYFTQPTTFQNRKFIYYYIIDPEKIKGGDKKSLLSYKKTLVTNCSRCLKKRPLSAASSSARGWRQRYCQTIDFRNYLPVIWRFKGWFFCRQENIRRRNKNRL